MVVAAVVGLIVALVQAATQLQEQTFQYAMKFFAIVVTIFATASLAGAGLYRFTDRIFSDFPTPGRLRRRERPRRMAGARGCSPRTVGFSTIRLAVAFLVVPIFSNDIMPALVRNAVFASLGLVVAVVQPLDELIAGSAGYLLLVVAKEVFLGLSLGILFGIFLWAFEAAGEIIDTQVGTAQAQILDPFSGHRGDAVRRFPRAASSNLRVPLRRAG